jgi:hypothetical protein
MKKILIAISIFNLLLSNPILAQADPGSDPLGPPVPGNLPNPGADPELPINDHEWCLVVVGSVFVFYKVRALNLQKI